MPRKPTENYHEYRDRMISPVSGTFCAAKWYNATIWLSQGETTSCHHPRPHKIKIEDLAHNPSAIHNTAHKKLMRKMMLAGQRPDECGYCWRVEDIGRDNISDRVFKTVIYQDEDIHKIAKDDWDEDVNLRTLEIAFDRTCQFACSYCNATFSTTWAKDINKNGPYENLMSPQSGAFRDNGDWAEPFAKDENPYIKAFWDWWPDLSKDLEELRITGGEPLMSDDVWKLLDKFGTEDIGHIRLAINSNLGGKDSLIDRLLEKSMNIKNLDLYTSCEAVGVQAEFIRDGLNWEVWCKNIKRVMSEGNVRRVHVMMTINLLSIFTLPEFLTQVMAWKHEFGRIGGTLGVSFNMLSYPSFQSLMVLPQHLKDRCKKQLIDWSEAHQDDKAYEMHERDALQRVVDVLDAGALPPDYDVLVNEKDVKQFYDQYQERRNLSIRCFPPEFLKWYDSIRAQTIIPIKAV